MLIRNLVIFLLLGVYFAPFMFKSILMFWTHAFWCVAIILGIFAYSFFEKNKALSLLYAWVILNSLWWIVRLVTAKFPLPWGIFAQVMNFTVLMILYQAIQKLDLEKIKYILNWIRYALIFHLFLCVLQIFNFSEFFYLFEERYSQNNIVFGMMGNPTQLSSFLTLLSPVLLISDNKRENFLAFVLIFIILFFTGTTKGEPSISGFVILAFILSSFVDIRIIGSLLLFLLSVGFFYRDYLPGNLFHFSGRLDLWKEYLVPLKEHFIAGNGLDYVNRVSSLTKFPKAHHLHLEPFQILLELGI